MSEPDIDHWIKVVKTQQNKLQPIEQKNLNSKKENTTNIKLVDYKSILKTVNANSSDDDRLKLYDSILTSAKKQSSAVYTVIFNYILLHEYLINFEKLKVSTADPPQPKTQSELNTLFKTAFPILYELLKREDISLPRINKYQSGGVRGGLRPLQPR